MKKLFGTDGVRGTANVELSPLLALKIGTTAAHVIIEHKQDRAVLVGRDPRISGDILESALVAGICSQGIDAILVGVIPTPGVAYLTMNAKNAAAGAVISASHNPVKDNGIKFFGHDGYKLEDSVEAEIESLIDRFDDFPKPQGKDVGNVFRKHELIWDYAEHVKSTSAPLEGMKLVIDCANGAASELAPRIFHELGARTTCVNCTPNGVNINEDCGSLHPDQMALLVRQTGADVGLSFDGDADRVIMADETGGIVDGDHMMAIYALYRARNGGLPVNTVVGTVMSNIGLELALEQENVKLFRALVGDRYVSDEMRRSGAVVGGEKSGHIILADHAKTGDGMITALQVLSIMMRTGKRLSELAAEMREFPQLLVNVRVAERDGWDSKEDILASIKHAEQKLGDRGRIVVRPSGTEKLIRVMAEGPDQAELDELVGDICETVKRCMGG